MNITPFKNRAVDYTQPVKIYRNLHKPGVVYSVQQNGLVVGYASKLSLCGCEFLVSEAGRQRVIAEKRKNVHAFITGTLLHNMLNDGIATTPVGYNPYFMGSFFIKNDTMPTPVQCAAVVTIDGTNIRARFA